MDASEINRKLKQLETIQATQRRWRMKNREAINAWARNAYNRRSDVINARRRLNRLESKIRLMGVDVPGCLLQKRDELHKILQLS